MSPPSFGGLRNYNAENDCKCGPNCNCADCQCHKWFPCMDISIVTREWQAWWYFVDDSTAVLKCLCACLWLLQAGLDAFNKTCEIICVQLWNVVGLISSRSSSVILMWLLCHTFVLRILWPVLRLIHSIFLEFWVAIHHCFWLKVILHYHSNIAVDCYIQVQSSFQINLFRILEERCDTSIIKSLRKLSIISLLRKCFFFKDIYPRNRLLQIYMIHINFWWQSEAYADIQSM